MAPVKRDDSYVPPVPEPGRIEVWGGGTRHQPGYVTAPLHASQPPKPKAMPWVAIAEYRCLHCGEPLTPGNTPNAMRERREVLRWHPTAPCPYANRLYVVPAMWGDTEPRPE